MSYRLIPPPPSLRAHVRYFWAMDHQTDDRSVKSFTVMSNGEPGLIFQEDPDNFSGFDGEKLPQLFVFGQATGYGQLQGNGSYRKSGISFHPSALKSVFGFNASELTDQHASISLLAKTSLQEQLLNCKTTEQQASCFFKFLEKQVKRHEDESKKLTYAVSALQQNKNLQQVLHELNLSERSLERLFKNHTGISPVLFARIARFQTALSILRQGSYRSLTDIAHELGYFDQSHFIRDFKQFSGASPRNYLRSTIERMPGFPEWQD